MLKLILEGEKNIMKKVRVNEVFKQESEVAIIVTDGCELKTLRMSSDVFEKSGIYDVGGGYLYVHKDENGNIIDFMPDRWFRVTQDRIRNEKDKSAYDYKHEYV